ncbi:hypothetical protein F4804DRAFT_298187, partial [Jackrogersella minutella]
MNQKVSSHHGHTPRHLQVEHHEYTRSTFLSPSSARSTILHSHQADEKPSHIHHSVNEHSRTKTVRSGTGYSHVRADAHALRDDEPSTLSNTSRMIHSPLQPRIILDTGENSTAYGSHASTIGPGSDTTSAQGGTSEFEIHRPSPIAPPNHDCSWKTRYLALAAEIRLLKAELSTRASLRGTDVDYTGQGGGIADEDDDDNLGIQGVTIIMHLRGRDDLIINTDLTLDP